MCTVPKNSEPRDTEIFYFLDTRWPYYGCLLNLRYLLRSWESGLQISHKKDDYNFRKTTLWILPIRWIHSTTLKTVSLICIFILILHLYLGLSSDLQVLPIQICSNSSLLLCVPRITDRCCLWFHESHIWQIFKLQSSSVENFHHLLAKSLLLSAKVLSPVFLGILNLRSPIEVYTYKIWYKITCFIFQAYEIMQHTRRKMK